MEFRNLLTITPLIAVLCLTTAGCASNDPATRHCQATTERMSQARWNCLTQASNAKKQEAKEAKCASYGFIRGTDGFRQCLFNLDQQVERQSATPAAPVNRQLTCTTINTGFGNSTTTCN